MSVNFEEIMQKLSLLLFLTLLPSSNIFAEEYTDKSFIDKLSLISDKGDETAKALFSITKKLNQFLNLKFHKIPGDAPNVTLKIEGTPPSNDTFRIIYFKRRDLNKMNPMEILHYISKQLIRRTLISFDAPRNVKVPDWLVAGYVYQYMAGETLSTLEKYPVSRLAIINKKFPDLDEFLSSQKPEPKNYWLYSIYAERSAVFLRGLVPLNRGKKNLFNYLINQQGKNISEFLSQKYESLKTKRLRNIWFKKAYQRVCFDVINPYPPNEIKEKVTRLLSVTIARPGNNGFGTMRISLEELSDENSKTIDHNYISLLEVSLMEISLTSSETIRPAIMNIVASLHHLKIKEYDDFKESLVQAKKKFNQALVRQNQLNQYLDELEKKHNNISTDYRRIILASELAETRKKEIFPELNLYLQELEKKLASVVIE